MDFSGIFQALFNIIGSPYNMLMLLVAVPMGMFFGAVPGLGGKIGVVMVIPFVFGMDPIPGAIFLISMHAVVHTAGSVPSILFGVPGTGAEAATIVDGLPMNKNGEAGRAMGAALGASGLGGIVGALFLLAILPPGAFIFTGLRSAVTSSPRIKCCASTATNRSACSV